MVGRRDLVAIMLVGTGLALLWPRWLQPREERSAKAPDPILIGDGLVIVDGWILRADEAAAVLA